MIANAKVASDSQIRLTSNTTANGTAQSKGTATDLMLVIVAGTDGANPVAGTVVPLVQGSNTSNGTYTTVTADKGTLANITVAGQQVLHFENLQYLWYRLNLSAAASTTADTSAVWVFQNLQDSFDNTVQ